MKLSVFLSHTLNNIRDYSPREQDILSKVKSRAYNRHSGVIYKAYNFAPVDLGCNCAYCR